VEVVRRGSDFCKGGAAALSPTRRRRLQRRMAGRHGVGQRWKEAAMQHAFAAAALHLLGSFCGPDMGLCQARLGRRSVCLLRSPGASL
jgi:hypothetical protein